MFKWFSKIREKRYANYVPRSTWKEDICYAYKLGKEIAMEELDEEFDTTCNCFTVEAMLDLSDHPSFTEYDVIDRGREFMIRALGEEVYRYAQHFITPDKKYIANVTICNPVDITEEDFDEDID